MKAEKVMEDLTTITPEQIQQVGISFAILFVLIYITVPNLSISLIATFIVFAIAYAIKNGNSNPKQTSRSRTGRSKETDK